MNKSDIFNVALFPVFHYLMFLYIHHCVLNIGATYDLRVFLSFFDLTLKTWHSLTNNPRPNPIFLSKHLAQRVYADSISADTASPSGRNQLIKIETLNAKGFRYSHPTVTKLVSFDCKFYSFSTPG